jgi:threonine/homoserine/homoserine lactone efflux protein
MVAAGTLAVFALAALALAAVPGPAVLYIVARSLHQGRRAGVVSALGVAAGGAVHVTGAVAGVSALLASSAVAFSAVRWAGAAYLVAMGVRTMRGADAAPVAAPPPAAARRLFGDGFVVNALNPKTALFFLAFLPQFVDASRGHAALQTVELGAVFLVVALSSDVCYACLAGTIGRRLGRSAGSRRVARLASGGVYVALGAGTVLAGRR